MNYRDVSQKIAEQLNLPVNVVNKTYKAYWQFIKNHIESLPLSQELSEEEFSEYRTNINIPSLGKLYCTYDRFLRVKKRFKIIQSLKSK